MARFKIFLGEYEQHEVIAVSEEHAIIHWLDREGYDTAEQALAEYFEPGDAAEMRAERVSG